MTYGGAIPSITPSYLGFVNGDSASSLTTAPVCFTTATASSPVGTYPSFCSGAASPNYTITYDNSATITVTPVPLLVTATPSSPLMPYGGPVPAVTPSYTGLVNGDTAPATPPICTTAATPTSPVSGSPYATSCSGASDPDYTITYDNAATIASLRRTSWSG